MARGRRSTVAGRLALVALLALVSACLPRGEPPAGRQLLAERQITIGALVPPNGDGTVRALFLRPGKGEEKRDVYLLSVDATGGAPREELLAEGADLTEDFGCLNMVAPCSMVTGRGLIFLWREGGLSVLDPYTAERFDFSPAPSNGPGPPGFIDYGYTASGGRVQVSVGSTTTVIDAGGGTTVLEHVYAPYFAGEDLYYRGSTGDLRRLRDTGADEPVASGVVDFRVLGSPETPLVVFNREDPQPDGSKPVYHSWSASKDYVPLSFLLDLVTGKEISLPFNPFDGDISSSPDGRWLLRTKVDWLSADGGTTVFFFDTRTGEQRTVQIGRAFGRFEWRPGHDEAWISGDGSDIPSSWIARPDGSSSEISGRGFGGFSDDGDFWLSASPTSDPDKSAFEVVSADDPTGPGTLANPPGSGINRSWWLADGRLLLQAYYKNYQRPDLLVVDPRSGESRRLAERGRVAAVGKNRVVGMFHYADGCGDLTSLELDTGRQTLLAPEFTVTAFAEGQGDDPVAKGTHVVYQYQARASSPYDGLWLVTVP